MVGLPAGEEPSLSTSAPTPITPKAKLHGRAWQVLPPVLTPMYPKAVGWTLPPWATGCRLALEQLGVEMEKPPLPPHSTRTHISLSFATGITFFLPSCELLEHCLEFQWGFSILFFRCISLDSIFSGCGKCYRQSPTYDGSIYNFSTIQ